MGGAYNRVPPDAPAFVHRTDGYLLKHETVLPTTAHEADRDSVRRWLIRGTLVAHRFGTGRGYQNFPQADQDLAEAAAAHYGANLPRLDHITRTYDPDGLFKKSPVSTSDTWGRPR